MHFFLLPARATFDCRPLHVGCREDRARKCGAHPCLTFDFRCLACSGMCTSTRAASTVLSSYEVSECREARERTFDSHSRLLRLKVLRHALFKILVGIETFQPDIAACNKRHGFHRWHSHGILFGIKANIISDLHVFVHGRIFLSAE